MKKLFLPSFIGLLVIFLGVSVLFTAFAQEQQPPSPRIEITGVNATDLPTATINVNVFDILGQPVRGLTAENFVLSGPLADVGRIVRVENITDDNLPFAVALVIDTSSSMSGTPLARAQAAATAFVESLRENDQAAIIIFNDDPVVYQEFTSDKDELRRAIETVPYGGETALYDAGVAGIEAAAGSLSRRVVILLSDGAEFGGASVNPRGAALEAAVARGVPVYTIGLGFGTDRTYLQELAAGTNARFYESPTPDELATIYQDIAGLLRSQYVITLEADLPLDGTEYAFGVQADTPSGSTNIAESTLRAPIPVPVVSIVNQPTEALTAPIDVIVSVLADDAIEAIDVTTSDGTTLTPQVEQINTTTSRFVIGIDPFTLSPDDYTYDITVTDSTGDSAQAQLNFTVDALPAQLAFDTDLTTLGEISEPQVISVTANGQTPPTSATFKIDGTELLIQDAAGVENTVTFEATVDPFVLSPGEHTLSVDVTSASGAVNTLEGRFTVAALPPVVVFNDLEPNQLIETETEFGISAVGQASIASIIASAGDAQLGEVQDATSGRFTVDPADFSVGALTLSATVTDANGQITTAELPVQIAALPASLIITGLEDGEVLDAPREITAAVVSQSDVAVTAAVNGNAIFNSTGVAGASTFTFTLDPLNFSPDTAHTLEIVADNLGEPTSQSFSVSFAPEFYITLTPATATSTPTPSPTVDAEATNTAGTQIAVQTAEAQATLDTQTSANATATANVITTQAAQSTADTVSTVSAQATLDANATLSAQATLDTEATTNADATRVVVEATSAAATSEVQSTQNAVMTATAELVIAQTADAQATLDVEAVTQAAQTAEAQATVNSNATVQAQATDNTLSTAEALAAAQAVADAQSTANARATRDAERAQQATRNAGATLTAQVTPSSTPRPQASATNTPAPSDTPAPTATDTAEPEPTETEAISAVAQAQTQTAEAPTDEPTEAATEEPTAEPTEPATEAATEEPTAEPSEEATIAPTATIFDPTATPVEPTDIEAPGVPQDDNTILLVGLVCGGLLLLLVIVLFLVRRRNQ